MDWEKAPLLRTETIRSVVKVLEVKSVEHKGQKRKRLQTEAEHKAKQSKLENSVKDFLYFHMSHSAKRKQNLPVKSG